MRENLSDIVALQMEHKVFPRSEHILANIAIRETADV